MAPCIHVDTYVAVDATEWLPLDLLLFWVDLDGYCGANPLTVLTLVTLGEIENKLSSGTRNWVKNNEWVVDRGWLAEKVFEDVVKELGHFMPSPSRL